MRKEKEREESSPVGSDRYLLAWMLRQNRRGNKRKHGQTFADAHCDFFPHDWSCNIAGCCRATGQMVPLRKEGWNAARSKVCACMCVFVRVTIRSADFWMGFSVITWKGWDWMINNCIIHVVCFCKKKKRRKKKRTFQDTKLQFFASE